MKIIKNFDTFKTKVISLARRNKVSYLIPNSDILYSLWQQELTPEQVVAQHCTKEAQMKRHNLR